MVVKIADNILSPLGATSQANYMAVKQGLSKLCLHPAQRAVSSPFFASLIDGDTLTIDNGYSKFERMCIQSAQAALAQSDIDPSSDKVLFILSTTKGNIDLLRQTASAATYPAVLDSNLLLGQSAKRICSYFGNSVTPLVVSNACISGLCAQILALRLLDSDDRYDYAVVIGADEQSPFIISGFQCLRALSPEACKPFDSERCGLNLGEAAATIIYGRSSSTNAALVWSLRSGAIRNDANHISGPSRTGEGSWLALMHTLYNIDTTTIAFINAHGTATLYNDEMESIAIERANLLSIPVNSLKGYYGHTMGAAGILETIISMQAIDDHTILGTKNFSSLGVSKPINVCAENKTTDKTAFVKLISGFGGCNAAAYFQKGGTL